MQQPQIVVGVVEHDFHIGALKQLAQFRWRSNRQRVDDRAALARRDLEQVDPIEKGMKARALGIEGELPDFGDLIEKAIYLGWIVEVRGALRFRGRHTKL